jgi:hypothetical protein
MNHHSISMYKGDMLEIISWGLIEYPFKRISWEIKNITRTISNQILVYIKSCYVSYKSWFSMY